MKPVDHYNQGKALLSTIADNKEKVDVVNAQVLATGAMAEALLGVLKLLIDLGPYAFLPNG